MPSFSARSLANLETCDERLQRLCHAAIEWFNFVVAEGHRGEEAQNRAFAEGKSKLKWPNGNHNKFPSTAADLYPYWINEGIRLDDLPAFAFMMGRMKMLADSMGIKVRFGLDFDGDLKIKGDETFIDAPHIEVLD